MKYKLVKSSYKDIYKLIEYKKRTIFEYAKDLSEEYRNKGIGTDIIKKVISNNDTIYLWVYKENLKAISLYKKIGFFVIDETESRYYMKYCK